jgi:hypothetical protein
MKVLVMHADRDFDWTSPPPPLANDLVQDLGLEALFGAMAGGDDVVRRVAQSALLRGLDSCDEILHRQQALADAIKHPEVVRGLHDLALQTLQEEKKIWSWFGQTPELNLHHAVDVMELLVGKLRILRQMAEENVQRFTSPAFRRLFAMLIDELDDGYFTEIQGHLERMRFRRGVLVSGGLGSGNAGVGYVLRRPPVERRGWLDRVRDRGDARLRFEIHPRDDGGHQALTELRSRGINLVADALSQSSDHVLGFFAQLRAELAFYVGCLNLRTGLEGLGHPTALPTPRPAGERILEASGLYDAVLALAMRREVVSNDVAASGKSLVLVTGANRGGKSTFLRSVGLAQLMMQAGMFVPAASYASSVANGVFTHFMREEDETMTRGKLDEELDRMSRIVDVVRSDTMLLCNESFASTNEPEGAEIGEQVFRALTDSGVRVLLVTHLYELARRFGNETADGVLSLRAERLADGTRTFKVRQGPALPTSFGVDVYKEVFDGSRSAAPGTAGSGGVQGADVTG